MPNSRLHCLKACSHTTRAHQQEGGKAVPRVLQHVRLGLGATWGTGGTAGPRGDGQGGGCCCLHQLGCRRMLH